MYLIVLDDESGARAVKILRLPGVTYLAGFSASVMATVPKGFESENTKGWPVLFLKTTTGLDVGKSRNSKFSGVAIWYSS